MLAIGPVIRHFFNSRHEGKGSPWWTWGVAAAGMAAIAWLSAAGPRTVTGALPPTPKFAEVSDIVMSRCSMCHAAEPVWAGIAAAPKGVMLDTDEHIRLHAPLIDDRRRALERDAARQRHRDDARRAADAGVVARRRRAGAVVVKHERGGAETCARSVAGC